MIQYGFVEEERNVSFLGLFDRRPPPREIVIVAATVKSRYNGSITGPFSVGRALPVSNHGKKIGAAWKQAAFDREHGNRNLQSRCNSITR